MHRSKERPVNDLDLSARSLAGQVVIQAGVYAVDTRSDILGPAEADYAW